MGVTMKRLLSALIVLMLAAPAGAQTLPIPLVTGPQDVSQMRAIFNTLIGQINAVLVPVFGYSTTPNGTPVNLISLSGGLTGSNATIGLQPGADANAGITINPNGSGNIQLFAQGDTGTLKFGNEGAFVKAYGLGACPGALGLNKQPIGVQPVVTGFLIVKDWLGASHGVPAC